MILLIVSLIVFYGIAIFMPKRISWLGIWATALFSLAVEGMSDLILDLHLNLFGYFSSGFQWSGVLVMFVYPPVNAIFLNYFPYERTKFQTSIYIVGWTAFCLGYEVVALKSGLFYYTTWKLWYSALSYPVLLLAVVWHFKFTQWLKRRAD